MTNQPCWYLAATYPNQQQARSVWSDIQKTITQYNVGITTFSIILAANWYVVTLADTAPDQQIQQLIKHYLASGDSATIPNDVLSSLMQRRVNRTRDVTRLPGQSATVYENHQPNIATYESDRQLTPEDAAKHMRLVVDSLTEQGLPFIAIYRMYADYKTMPDSLDGIDYQATLDKAAKYMFTQSARAMHTAVNGDDIDWIDFSDMVWIEQDRPQYIDALNMYLKAVYVYTIPGYRIITIIDQLTNHRMMLLYEVETQAYSLAPGYTCPYGECRDTDMPYTDTKHIAYRKGCEQCNNEGQMWIAWLHTALKMLRRDYVTDSNPSPFDQVTKSYTERQLVPRHHGKGLPKNKLVSIDIPYTLVRYDVTSSPDTRTLADVPAAATRMNWLTIHGRDALIYRRVHFTDIKRRYVGSHYNRLIERCRQSGSFTEDGRRYTLEKLTDGSYQVISTLIDFDRYVPMLKPEKRKKTAIKKVIATSYQGRDTNE